MPPALLTAAASSGVVNSAIGIGEQAIQGRVFQAEDF